MCVNVSGATCAQVVKMRQFSVKIHPGRWSSLTTFNLFVISFLFYSCFFFLPFSNGVFWKTPDGSLPSVSVIFRLLHGGDAKADKICLFTEVEEVVVEGGFYGNGA